MKKKININRKLFIQSVFNMVKDSEFMDSVIIELLENYQQNTDEQNMVEYDETLLDSLLEKAIELEWYELCARIVKQKENVTTIK